MRRLVLVITGWRRIDIVKLLGSMGIGKIGEAFVNEIAFNSFLKHWCYPDPKGNKKQIIDLLIVFKDVVIIMEVKNYEFKGAYSRYFKKTINKAVNQIYGAERKLFKIDRDIYIKHPDKKQERFPKEIIKKGLGLL